MLNPTAESNPGWKNGLWYSYSDFLRKQFGLRVYKLTVAAGFTCPTRDGTRGSEGCAFCDERGSSSFYSSGRAGMGIREQLEKAMPDIRARFRADKFLAYFQSYTNTYGPLSYLREVYDGAVNVPDIVGMAIGTRPDCISDEVLALLSRYARDRFIALELGLQSFRDDSLEFYMRGHSVAEGIDGIQRALLFPNLHVAVHLMFGAPGETVEDAIQAARKINELGVHGVKIHQLMILAETILAKRYAVQPWPLLSMEEFNEMAIAFLEELNPNIYVERTHALSSHPNELVGPKWSAERHAPMNQLRKMLADRGSWQGKKYKSGAPTLTLPPTAKFNEQHNASFSSSTV